MKVSLKVVVVVIGVIAGVMVLAAKSDTVTQWRPSIAPKVQIDIKPSSNPNSVNPNSTGEIAVAILADSRNDIDIYSIIIESVRFLGASPCKFAFEDVGVSPEKPDGKPLPPDGDVDLLLHFDKGDMVFPAKGYWTITVAGYYRTEDGRFRRFSGTDVMRVLK